MHIFIILLQVNAESTTLSTKKTDSKIHHLSSHEEFNGLTNPTAAGILCYRFQKQKVLTVPNSIHTRNMQVEYKSKTFTHPLSSFGKQTHQNPTS